MSTGNQPWYYSASSYLVTNGDEVDPEQWFAVQTRARHEKAVVQRLREVGVETFLPLIRGVHRWSDRRKTVELPLFSCYVFVRLAPKNEKRLRVLLIDGVLNFVGPRGQEIPIPDEQIESIRRLLQGQLPYCSHPFLKIGQRVRIRSGALDGVEGILVSRSGERTLIISVDALDRSLAVRIEGYDVEPI
jgi:transcription termination/antitermination protein NusG